MSFIVASGKVSLTGDNGSQTFFGMRITVVDNIQIGLEK